MSEAMVFDVDDGITHPLDEQICAIVGQVLTQHYPGHMWRVDADHRAGMVDVRNLSLDGKHGIRMKMDGPVTASELMREAMLVGGEILERYGVTRGIMNPDEIEALPQDRLGNCEAQHD